MKPVAIIWFALMMSTSTFVGVAWFLGPQMRTELPELFIWVMLGVAVMNSVMSRVMPSLMKGSNAQSKAIIGFAFAESAAIVSGISWMLTGDVRSLVGIGVGFLALASLFPRDKRDGETVRLMPP